VEFCSPHLIVKELQIRAVLLPSSRSLLLCSPHSWIRPPEVHFAVAFIEETEIPKNAITDFSTGEVQEQIELQTKGD
jgi:hypothetical protein